MTTQNVGPPPALDLYYFGLLLGRVAEKICSELGIKVMTVHGGSIK